MIANQLPQKRIIEGTCSDCGRITGHRERFVDPHTRSEVELCSNCAAAFVHRQHFAPGCCD
jgi:hypothetical protein